MNRRLLAAVACLAPLSFASASSASVGTEPVPSVDRPPISAGAPCSGVASISVKLSDNPAAHEPDHLRVHVDGAKPHHVWRVSIEVYQGDTGSVEATRLRTNADGDWTVRTSGASGFQRIRVAAHARGGQGCKLTMTGRVAPL